MQQKKSGGRLSRADWLTKALEVLSKEGQAGLQIQGICTALGVSRGSFYWHFEDRGDFIRALLDYWFEEYTAIATNMVTRSGGTAEERLSNIIDRVHEQNLTRYDMVFRSLATIDADVAKSVKRADAFWLKYLKGLFGEMGFTENEKEIRARTCLSFMTVEAHMFDILDGKHRDDLVDDLLAFLVRK
jgi:AcrR family transcriptional regulator